MQTIKGVWGQSDSRRGQGRPVSMVSFPLKEQRSLSVGLGGGKEEAARGRGWGEGRGERGVPGRGSGWAGRPVGPEQREQEGQRFGPRS